MNFIESIQTCYKKTFNFKDRASKSEFWWFYLYDGSKDKNRFGSKPKNKL